MLNRLGNWKCSGSTFENEKSFFFLRARYMFVLETNDFGFLVLVRFDCIRWKQEIIMRIEIEHLNVTVEWWNGFCNGFYSHSSGYDSFFVCCYWQWLMLMIKFKTITIVIFTIVFFYISSVNWVTYKKKRSAIWINNNNPQQYLHKNLTAE